MLPVAGGVGGVAGVPAAGVWGNVAGAVAEAGDTVNVTNPDA